MGNKSSSSTKSVLIAKLDNSKKTGVLNLVDLKLSLQADIWSKIDPEGLKLIDISGNPLKSLPVEIYSMTNLKKLKCSRCGLERIFSALTNNACVTHIDADNNQLEIDLIGALPPSLLHLNLAHNVLSAIPLSLHPLKLLTSLDLSSNRIETLQGLEQLVALVDLNVDDNQILEIPQETASLQRLKKISIRRNRIGQYAAGGEAQSIHADVFIRSNVEAINLEGNALSKALVMRFEGVDKFLERRKKAKDKNILSGAATDLDLFGLQ